MSIKSAAIMTIFGRKRIQIIIAWGMGLEKISQQEEKTKQNIKKQRLRALHCITIVT